MKHFDAVAVSGTNTYYSEWCLIGPDSDPSWHLEWTSTPTGTFTLQGSNKENPAAASDADAVDITLGVPITQPAGAAGKDLLDGTGFPFKRCRLKYVNAAGSGTITATYNRKRR